MLYMAIKNLTTKTPQFFRVFKVLSYAISALVLSFAILAHASEFKIFTLQHRFANDLVPIVTPLAGETGTVSAINNQLIVRTDAASMREIEAVVAALDIARVNRKIHFSFNRNSQMQTNNTEASGNVRVGKVTVGNQRRSPPNSGRIDIERNQTQQQSQTTQFLNVLDGENGFIRVGQIVPYTQEWITFTRRYTHIQTNTDWQEVTTGFAVRPTTINNQVELAITPRIAKLNSRQSIDFEELSTIIRVNIGEWVNIGNTVQQHDEVSRKILGSYSRQGNEQSEFWVKVD
jgi:Bacterial type II/III secretion system short domain